MDQLQLASGDDVAVIVTDDHPGIPRGHKVALRDLAAGEEVHKYGQLIGVATQAIRVGEHVHVHNLAMPPRAGERVASSSAAVTRPAEPLTFEGIRRPDGRVATRNYIGVLTSVNCS